MLGIGFHAVPGTPLPGKKVTVAGHGSRADASFVVGMVIDKFDYHLPLYRQHRRLDDAGIKLSRPWLTH